MRSARSRISTAETSTRTSAACGFAACRGAASASAIPSVSSSAVATIAAATARRTNPAAGPASEGVAKRREACGGAFASGGVCRRDAALEPAGMHSRRPTGVKASSRATCIDDRQAIATASSRARRRVAERRLGSVGILRAPNGADRGSVAEAPRLFRDRGRTGVSPILSALTSRCRGAASPVIRDRNGRSRRTGHETRR
jgi:hypothetical protein